MVPLFSVSSLRNRTKYPRRDILRPSAAQYRSERPSRSSSFDRNLAHRIIGCTLIRMFAGQFHVFLSTGTGPDFQSRGAPGDFLPHGAARASEVRREILCFHLMVSVNYIAF